MIYLSNGLLVSNSFSFNLNSLLLYWVLNALLFCLYFLYITSVNITVDTLLSGNISTISKATLFNALFLLSSSIFNIFVNSRFSISCKIPSANLNYSLNSLSVIHSTISPTLNEAQSPVPCKIDSVTSIDSIK